MRSARVIICPARVSGLSESPRTARIGADVPFGEHFDICVSFIFRSPCGCATGVLRGSGVEEPSVGVTFLHEWDAVSR